MKEKGADATCVNVEGYTAAQMAFATGKTRVHRYLKAQETQQAKQKEEQKKAAAAAATEVARMQEVEESMAALLLELEAEEEAASSKKNGGKASAGKKTSPLRNRDRSDMEEETPHR